MKSVYKGEYMFYLSFSGPDLLETRNRAQERPGVIISEDVWIWWWEWSCSFSCFPWISQHECNHSWLTPQMSFCVCVINEWQVYRWISQEIDSQTPMSSPSTALAAPRWALRWCHSTAEPDGDTRCRTQSRPRCTAGRGGGGWKEEAALGVCWLQWTLITVTEILLIPLLKP